MGDSLEGQEPAPEAQNVAVVDFNAFINYLRKAATVLLPEDESQGEPPALVAALEDKSNHETVRKFISDSQVQTLFIQRSSCKGIFYRFFAMFFLSFYIPNIDDAQLVLLVFVFTAVLKTFIMIFV